MNQIPNVRNYAKMVARAFGYVIYGGCVVNCFVNHIGDLVMCVGPSMEPTIYSHNVVFTKRFSTRHKMINRGDIVICISPFDPRVHICKRVIALPGDKIRSGLFSQVIPKGHVWLEGDNKYNSSDSRNFGPIPQGLLRGKVICRIWPLTNMKMLTAGARHNT